jgi:AraC family transcriptional regulator, transcriptional activator FtrA
MASSSLCPRHHSVREQCDPVPTGRSSDLNDIRRKKTDVVSNRDVREDRDMARRRHHVVTVVASGMSALEPAVAHDFFGYDRSDLTVDWYRYSVVGASPLPQQRPFRAHVPEPDHGLLRRADTIVIPGWSIQDRDPDPELVDALRHAHARGARLVTFCTGAFLVAEAGLLDGHRATTHWEFAPLLAERFPTVEVDPAVLYVDDGDILTSAGAAASIDLAVHVIRRDFGAEVANAVARDMVVPPHRDGGQAQFIQTPVIPPGATDDHLLATMTWAAEHLGDDLSVADLAAHATLSPRQFSRQFRARTGTSPHQWLLTQRTSLAQRLLETTDQPIERIATDAGFGTAAAMRLHFQRALHTSPAAYRRCFRCEEDVAS